MKGGVAVALRLAATMPVTEPRRHLPVLRVRGGRGRAQRPAAARRRRTPSCSQADFAVLMEPSDAVVEAGCQGTLRVDVTHHAASAPTRPGPGRASTRSTRAADGARPAERLRAAAAGDRRAGVPRGPQRGLHLRRGRRQRACPTVRGLGQLPLRARPVRGGGAAPTCARSSTAFEVELERLRPGRAARPVGAGRRGVRRGGRRHRRTRSSGGPTWRGSARWASRRSTSARATRIFAHKQDEHVPLDADRRRRDAAAHLAGGGARDRAATSRAVPRPDRDARATRSTRAAPPTSGCSTPAAPTDWVHTDPWRVLRIQSEFVEGFGALAELGSGDLGLRLRPHRRDDPAYATAEAGRRGARRGRVRGHHRRRPGRRWRRRTRAPRGRRRLGRARHRAALRDRAQPVRRPRASTSATSSPARRCS